MNSAGTTGLFREFLNTGKLKPGDLVELKRPRTSCVWPIGVEENNLARAYDEYTISCRVTRFVFLHAVPWNDQMHLVKGISPEDGVFVACLHTHHELTILETKEAEDGAPD